MKSLLSNKAYDILKWISLVALNAIGVCYKSIATIWHLPYGTEVLATCSAIALCIGALIGISSATYNANKDVSDTLDTFEDFKEGDDVK